MNSQQIEPYCQNREADVVVKIPFDNVFTKEMVHGMPVVKYFDGVVNRKLRQLWQGVVEMLANN